METDEELFINPWEPNASRVIDSLTRKYLMAYDKLEKLAKTSGVVQAKTVQDTLMEIFRIGYFVRICL